MAKAKPKKKAAAPSSGKGGINKGVVLVILAALIPFSLPTVTLVFFCALPTMGAWIAEKAPNKYAWLCVGGLNFAGMLPFLFDLWFGVHTLDEALNMLSNSSVLLWAYGCAGLGWGLYMVTPPVVKSWLIFITDRRVASLKSAQKKLVEDWGNEVTKKNA